MASARDLGSTGSGHGPESVLIRPSDGALIVGEGGGVGTTIDLHLIHLSGDTVTSDVRFTVGQQTMFPSLGIPQCALLADGDVLVGVFGIGSGPLAGFSIGRINLSTGAVTGVPVTLPIGVIPGVNALCVDDSSNTCYFSMHNGGPSATLFSVPIQGGTAQAIVTVPANISNLLLRPDQGTVLASSLADAMGDAHVFEIDPATGQFTTCSPGFGRINALAWESVTGNLAAAAWTPANQYCAVRLGPWAACSSNPLSCGGGPIGWERISGVDVAPDPALYCEASPKTNEYAWQLAPNPGGLPAAGNASFSLTLESTPGSAPGLLLIGIAPAEVAASGITLCVDPFPAVVDDPGTRGEPAHGPTADPERRHAGRHDRLRSDRPHRGGAVRRVTGSEVEHPVAAGDGLTRSPGLGRDRTRVARG